MTLVVLFAGLSVAMFTLGTCFLYLPAGGNLNSASLKQDSATLGASATASTAIIAIYAFAGFYSLGLAPMISLLPCEVYPIRLRAQALSIGGVVNRFTSSVISFSFLNLAKTITPAG